MKVSLWLKSLAITSAVICSLFGFSFFYFAPAVVHDGIIALSDRLFAIWLLSAVCCGLIATRLARFRHITAVVFCWFISVVPLLLAIAMVVESFLVPDSNLARYLRMSCLIVLVVGLLFEARVYYYVFRNKLPNA
jgi:hypothetical protein